MMESRQGLFLGDLEEPITPPVGELGVASPNIPLVVVTVVAVIVINSSAAGSPGGAEPGGGGGPGSAR
jgi:hypothetical protein